MIILFRPTIHVNFLVRFNLLSRSVRFYHRVRSMEMRLSALNSIAMNNCKPPRIVCVAETWQTRDNIHETHRKHSLLWFMNIGMHSQHVWSTQTRRWVDANHFAVSFPVFVPFCTSRKLMVWHATAETRKKMLIMERCLHISYTIDSFKSWTFGVRNATRLEFLFPFNLCTPLEMGFSFRDSAKQWRADRRFECQNNAAHKFN